MASINSKDPHNEGRNSTLPFQRQDEALLLSSLQEFDAQFPTEEAAREDVKTRLKQENLLFCHDCNSHNLEKKYGARVLKCLDCSSKTWVTAGTFFHHAKRLKPRLAVLWLMERGFIISSSKLHKLADVAQSSAFNILKRVAIVIEAHLERNICEIPSAVFSKVICKRSRETPARAHPIAEQEELDAVEKEQYLEQEQQANLQKHLPKEHQEKLDPPAAVPLQEQLHSPAPIFLQEELNASEIASLQEHPSDLINITASSDTTDLINDIDDLAKNTGGMSQPADVGMPDSTYNQLSQQEKTLYDLLSENPISFEELYARSNMSVANATASLVILEIAGLISSLPGNNYIRCSVSKDTIKNKANSDALAKFETIALATESFIRNSFHGISRKYLQHYLSIYWYYIDKNFWQIGSLLDACFSFRPVKLTEIISYVTPPTIRYCEI